MMSRKVVNIFISIIILTAILIWGDIVSITIPKVNADDPPPDDAINGIQFIFGDWNVSDTQTYTDEIIVLTGNLNISSGGNLTLNNVTLMMNNTNIDAEYNIEVFRGGTLNILADSVITDSPYDIDDESSSDYEFMFWVREGSNFTMKDSELYECGYYWYNGGLIIYTDGIILDNNFISHCYIGISLRLSSHSKITNNHIQYSSYAGIHLDGSRNNIIFNNEISNGSTGIVLNLGSSENNVSNNVINKYSFSGISLSQGSESNTIFENTIHDGEYGISIGGAWGHDFITINNNIIYNNSKAGLFLIDLNIGPGKSSNHEGNILYNNTCGIYLSGSCKNNFNRTIIHNSDTGIEISGGRENRLINSSISNSRKYDIYFSTLVSDSGELTLLNTTYHKSKVFFEGNHSYLTIQWYLHVYARDLNRTPIPNANVTIRNSKGELVKSGFTDDNGFLRWTVVTECIQNQTTNLTFNPHNISVIKGDLILYADPEPVINQTMQVNIPPDILKSEEIENNFPWIWALLTIVLMFVIIMIIVIYRKRKNIDEDNDS
ncbi:MAG: right-handed parallel beta-helix repeat-containing protein [Thermoplasmata archaeon]|nr:MAG: right-handed parallel beta-helix repeat-containing protein [Thermoplasmata archaeon]